MAKTHEERLFGAACLRVKLGQMLGDPGDNEIYRDALVDLDLQDDEVVAYLREHQDVVESALKQHGQQKN